MKKSILVILLNFTLLNAAYVGQNYSNTINCKKSDFYIIEDEINTKIKELEKIKNNINVTCTIKQDKTMSKHLICQNIKTRKQELPSQQEILNTKIKELNDLNKKTEKLKLCTSAIRFKAKNYWITINDKIKEYNNINNFILNCKEVLNYNENNVCSTTNSSNITTKVKSINKTFKFKKYTKPKNPFKSYYKL